ncbi:hypothetical protein, conserved [Angomonas deanei]|uniref:Surface antigen-like protein n=1 Tax=Angomonas deanei TaxID=59799 RepID=A0A7G2CPN8_9TRYP|nr:hypothetical protein, conserved [Angomonas deanei]CAD2220934.1 hypothetical protein, conserved [Angomonas deanei]
MFSASHVRNTLAAAAVTVMLVAAQDSNCAETETNDEGAVVCANCVTDYTLGIDGVCYLTSGGCIQAVDGKCQHCRGGFTLNKDEGTCVKCNKDCTCDAKDPNKCVGCKVGYGLDGETGNCVACKVSDCASCSQSSDKCGACMPNFLLVENACVSCAVDECTRCKADDMNTCDLCDLGNYLKEGKCKTCGIRNCDSCQEVEGVVRCDACAGDRTYDAESRTCKSGNAALPSSSSVLSLIAAVSAAVITLAL